MASAHKITSKRNPHRAEIILLNKAGREGAQPTKLKTILMGMKTWKPGGLALTVILSNALKSALAGGAIFKQH